MNKIIHLTLVAVLFVISAAASASAQEAVSPEKMALIREFVEITGGKQQFDAIMASMMLSQREQVKQTMETLFKDDKSLAPFDMAPYTKIAEESADRMSARALEYFQKKFNFDKFVNDVFVTVYAKHFSDDDLRDIIKFYKSPTGQKMTRATPAMMLDIEASIGTHLLPDFLEFMKKAMDEEIATITKNLPKPPKPRRK